MTLSDEHKATISTWIEAGANLPEIQKRLKEELGISLTYLETRLLADDLKLRLKEPERPVEHAVDTLKDAAGEAPAALGKVSVTIDQITRPGALVSGRVTFSDGEKAEWYLDQTGRLGLNANTPGYRPTQTDVAEFQMELERAARSQGL
jgi:hypothetical protein